jgi:hypothetical protein
MENLGGAQWLRAEVQQRTEAKKATEGEGKGNVVCNPKEITGGALYEIAHEELIQLDQWGEGLFSEGIASQSERGLPMKAWVYLAQPSAVKDGLKPTKAYLPIS